MSNLLAEKRLTTQQMLEDLPGFMQKIESLADLLQLDLSFAQADHIALRVNENQTAQLSQQMWSEQGKVISQANINGRPIIVIEFDAPLASRGWKSNA